MLNECVVSVCHECYIAFDWIWNNWFVFRKVLSIHQSPYQRCHNNVKCFCVFLGKSHVYQRASVQRRLAKEFIFIFVQNTYFQNQNNCFQNSVCERIEGRQRKSSLQARQDWRGSCFSIHTPIQSRLLINSDVNIISKSWKALSSSNQQSPYFPYLQQPSLHLLRIKT